MKMLVRIRRVWGSFGRGYYDTKVGITVQSCGWMVGPGFSLAVFYWPGRVWYLNFSPAEPTVCDWAGCANRPVRGGRDCVDHELPF